MHYLCKISTIFHGNVKFQKNTNVLNLIHSKKECSEMNAGSFFGLKEFIPTATATFQPFFSVQVEKFQQGHT
jgi:hypothetical protein